MVLRIVAIIVVFANISGGEHSLSYSISTVVHHGEPKTEHHSAPLKVPAHNTHETSTAPKSHGQAVSYQSIVRYDSGHSHHKQATLEETVGQPAPIYESNLEQHQNAHQSSQYVVNDDSSHGKIQQGYPSSHYHQPIHSAIESHGYVSSSHGDSQQSHNFDSYHHQPTLHETHTVDQSQGLGYASSSQNVNQYDSVHGEQGSYHHQPAAIYDTYSASKPQGPGQATSSQSVVHHQSSHGHIQHGHDSGTYQHQPVVHETHSLDQEQDHGHTTYQNVVHYDSGHGGESHDSGLYHHQPVDIYETHALGQSQGHEHDISSPNMAHHVTNQGNGQQGHVSESYHYKQEIHESHLEGQLHESVLQHKERGHSGTYVHQPTVHETNTVDKFQGHGHATSSQSVVHHQTNHIQQDHGSDSYHHQPVTHDSIGQIQGLGGHATSSQSVIHYQTNHIQQGHESQSYHHQPAVHDTHSHDHQQPAVVYETHSVGQSQGLATSSKGAIYHENSYEHFQGHDSGSYHHQPAVYETHAVGQSQEQGHALSSQSVTHHGSGHGVQGHDSGSYHLQAAPIYETLSIGQSQGHDHAISSQSVVHHDINQNHIYQSHSADSYHHQPEIFDSHSEGQLQGYDYSSQSLAHHDNNGGQSGTYHYQPAIQETYSVEELQGNERATSSQSVVHHETNHGDILQGHDSDSYHHQSLIHDSEGQTQGHEHATSSQNVIHQDLGYEEQNHHSGSHYHQPAPTHEIHSVGQLQEHKEHAHSSQSVIRYENVHDHNQGQQSLVHYETSKEHGDDISTPNGHGHIQEDHHSTSHSYSPVQQYQQDYYKHPKYDLSAKNPHTEGYKTQHEEGDLVKGLYSLHESDDFIRTAVKYSAGKLSGFNGLAKNSESSHHVEPQRHQH